MYCIKCGKELTQMENYCTQCGTKVIRQENIKGIDLRTSDLKEKTMEMKDNFVFEIRNLGETKIFLGVHIVCLFLSLLFANTRTIKVSGWLDISQSASMFDGSGGVKIFFILCYLLSVFFMVKPLLMKEKWKPSSFLCSKITTITMMIFFLLAILVGLDEISSQGYENMVELSITTTGWLFVITTIGAMVLAFKMSIDAKKTLRPELYVENAIHESKR